MYNLLNQYIKNYKLLNDSNIINNLDCRYRCNRCEEKTLYNCILDSIKRDEHV